MENLNAVKGKYATKRTFFSHSSMLCKAALTAIDNNINTNRLQVCHIMNLGFLDFVFSLFKGRTASGILQFDLITNRDGAKYYVRPRMEEKDFSWKDALMSIVLQFRKNNIYFPLISFLFIFQAFHDRKMLPNLLPLAPELKQRKKTAVRPDKAEAVARHQSRMATPSRS